MQGQGWRLEGGRYAPWLPDAQGRWASALGVAFGFEGIWLLVSAADGRTVPREGRILRSVAEAEVRSEVRMLMRILTRRLGPLQAELETRMAELSDPAALEALTDLAVDAPDIAAFMAAL